MIFSSLATLMSVISFGGSFDYTTSETFNMWIEYNRSIHIEIDDFFYSNNGDGDLLMYYNDNTQYESSKTLFGQVEVGSEIDDELFWYYETWCNPQDDSNIYISCYYDCYVDSDTYEYHSPFVYGSRYLRSQSMDTFELSNSSWVRGDTVYCRLEIDIYLIPQEIYGAIGESYNSGYDDGYRNGYDYGSRVGHDTGYSEGYAEGRQVGFAEGEQSGTAYSNGYLAGYQNGLQQSTRDFGFMNLFTAIADTPVLMMRSMFDFSIFGTSVLAVVLSLFTALVVIHLLKKIIK